MHPQSPILTIDGTVLKESDDLVIFGVTFDQKRTFNKHLHSVSRVASQRLGILRKSWQVFHDRLLLGRCVRGSVLFVLEYCSAVWCSAADTHHILLDRVVSDASFLTGGVSLICGSIMYAVHDQMQPDAHFLWCSICAVCAGAGYTRRFDRTSVHLCASSLKNLAVSHDCEEWAVLFPYQYLCSTIFVSPCSMVWDWRVSRTGPMFFYWPGCSPPFRLQLFSLSLLSFYGLWSSD